MALIFNFPISAVDVNGVSPSELFKIVDGHISLQRAEQFFTKLQSTKVNPYIVTRSHMPAEMNTSKIIDAFASS